jgi:hypothetical protein
MIRFNILKQTCRRDLRPVMEMLMQKRYDCNEIEWMGNIKLTEQRILEKPAEYLSVPCPPHLLDSIIHLLFTEFIYEKMYRQRYDPVAPQSFLKV